MCREEGKCTEGFLGGRRGLKERDSLESLVVDVKIILKWVYGRTWTGFTWMRIGTRGGLLRMR